MFIFKGKKIVVCSTYYLQSFLLLDNLSLINSPTFVLCIVLWSSLLLLYLINIFSDLFPGLKLCILNVIFVPHLAYILCIAPTIPNYFDFTVRVQKSEYFSKNPNVLKKILPLTFKFYFSIAYEHN